MAFKTLSGFLESLFYMLFLEGHFVNFWNLQMCINLTVSAASLNFFSGLVFAILVVLLLVQIVRLM